MNYLAQGLQQGWDSSFNALTQKKRDQQLAQAQLEKEAREAMARKALQDDQLAQQAKLFFADQSFRGQQAGEERGFRRSEREATQGFEGDQRGQDRSLSAEQLNTRLAADAQSLQQRLAQEKLLADAARMQSQGQFDTRFGWEKDPANPENKSREAYAKKIASEYPDFGNLPSPVTYKSADEVKAAYQGGKISREAAADILRKQFGLN
jgi:hypothetical protein